MKLVPTRPESAALLREVQRSVLDAGLQMTRFAPGAETSDEFTGALSVAVEIMGSWNELTDYVRALAGLPDFWIVDRLSIKTVSPADPRSAVRASVALRAFFSR